ncbi:MAG: hypothetical protein WAQ33_12975 [Gaiellaceae bacterium]
MAEKTYAVYWSDAPDGHRYAGRIAVRSDYAELSGSGSGRRSLYRLRFDEIASVRYERGRVHVRRRSGEPIWIGSLDGPGALKELENKLQAALVPA